MQPLTLDDQMLIEEATGAIARNFVLGRHHVGAAVRAASGKVYTGVHLESPGLDVCAEAVALGAAAAQGEREFETIVAVTAKGAAPRVLSPCGICRELINYYGRDIFVLLEDGEAIQKMHAHFLLPAPCRKTPAL